MNHLEEMRKCVARELARRCERYPQLIGNQHMAADEANREIEVMRMVDTLLRTLTEPELNAILANKELPLYQEFVAAYSDFMRGRGTGALLFNGRDGKAIKEIYAKLKATSLAKSDDGALQSWQYILKNWGLLSEFLKTQVSPGQINKNLLEILDKLRNGKKTTPKAESGSGPGSARVEAGKLWNDD